MATEHSQLTGAQLHEPKGVATATAGTVYIADGSGSGSWQTPNTSIVQPNSRLLQTSFTDITNPSSVYFYIPHNCSLVALTVITYAPVTGGDDVLRTYVNGTSRPETSTVTAAGSAAGVASTMSYSGTTLVSAGSIVRIDSDGGSTNTNTVRADVQLEINYV